jgi:outer membrane protein assembly factor BamB
MIKTPVLMVSLAVLAGFLFLGLGCQQEVRPGHIRMTDKEKKARYNILSRKLERMPLYRKWDSYVLAGDLVRRVYMTRDMIFLETGRRKVILFDRHKGMVRWIYSLDFPLRYPPAVSNEYVYLISRDLIHCVWRKGGDVKWKKMLPFVQGSPAAANDFYLYLAAGDIARLYAFKEAIQNPKTASGQFLGSVEAIDEWFFRTADLVRAKPISIENVLYFTSYDHRAYAIDATKGKLTWAYETGKQIVAPPYIRKGVMYIGGLDHTLHALNRFSGPPPKWLFSAGGPIMRAPAADDDCVYVRAEEVLDEYGLPGSPILFAVDVKTGRKVWEFERGQRMLFSGKDKVYILREGNVLVILDKKTGRRRAEFPLPDFKFLITNDMDDVLYLINDRGFIFALQESNPNPFK